MSLCLSEVLDWVQGKWVNQADLSADSKSQGENIRVEAPSPLRGSASQHLAYFFSEAYKDQLPQAAPGILLVGDPFVEPLKAAGLPLWKKSAVVACKDPYFAMALLSEKFAQKLSLELEAESSEAQPEVHTTAVVDPQAELALGVKIGPYCVVEKGARIASGTVLYPHCYVGTGSVLGEGCRIFAGVKIYPQVTLGKGVRVHANTVLGSDGFGYAPIVRDGKVGGHQKIHHFGGVKIGDFAELGAAVTVDRGTLEDTVIGPFVKLDNQVHIGHNARVDEGAILCGCTALAGRVHVGAYVYVGGLVGIANNLEIGDGAKVGAMSLITKDIPAGETHVGNPQREHSQHFRAQAALNKLLRKRSQEKRKNV